MEIIPVIDIKGGIAVQAVRGQRERYAPLRSVLAGSADPAVVARALRTQLGLDELYVAELDAISGAGEMCPSIGPIAREGPVILDAGIGEVERARVALATAIAGLVIGTETLPSAQALERIRRNLAGTRIVLSLDLYAGRVLSRAPELRGQLPGPALALLAESGVREAIVLDLGRVGTRAGPDLGLIAALHRDFPSLSLLCGGGVRDARDLHALRHAGAAGALVGTALHDGSIGYEQLTALGDGA